MSITKRTNRFRVLYISLTLVILSLVAYRVFFYTPVPEILKVETFRISGGWGYRVFVRQQLFIDQPFIPGIPGKKPFPDRRSALRAAKTVKAKMLQGQRPTLTRDDILKTGVDSLGNSN
jgi:hypothetical protein